MAFATSQRAAMYRIYKSTTQRVMLNVKSLNSNAAFLIVVPKDKQLLAWIGTECDTADSDLVIKLGETILAKDFHARDSSEVQTILEGDETDTLLEAMLDLFWTTSTAYYSKAVSSARRQKITNSSVSVGLIEAVSWGSDPYDLQETAFAHPDAKGTVPRVTFVPVELKTIAYVNIGDQWDIWISRGVSQVDEASVMSYLSDAISAQLFQANPTFKKDYLSQYINVVRQGEEHTMFRRPLKIFTDFEPPGKTAPRPEPAPRMKKEKKTTSVLKQAEEKKDADYSNTAANTAANAGSLESKGQTVVDFATSISTVVTKKGDSTTTANNNSTAPVVDFWTAPNTYSKSAAAAENKLLADSKNVNKSNNNNNEIISAALETIRNEYSDLNNNACLDGNNSNTTSPPPSLTTSPNALMGNNLSDITPGMLTLVESENENPLQRKATIDMAARNPKSLIGYQVEIDEGIYAGVFVVTKVKKTLFKKTVFFLTAADGDEFWIRLKRNNKAGQAFRPLRRVVAVNNTTTTTMYASTTTTAADNAGNNNNNTDNAGNTAIDISDNNNAVPSSSSPSDGSSSNKTTASNIHKEGEINTSGNSSGSSIALSPAAAVSGGDGSYKSGGSGSGRGLKTVFQEVIEGDEGEEEDDDDSADAEIEQISVTLIHPSSSSVAAAETTTAASTKELTISNNETNCSNAADVESAVPEQNSFLSPPPQQPTQSDAVEESKVNHDNEDGNVFSKTATIVADAEQERDTEEVEEEVVTMPQQLEEDLNIAATVLSTTPLQSVAVEETPDAVIE